MVSNVNSRTFEPETLTFLQQIYDRCLEELVTTFTVDEPIELNGIRDQVALRIISAFAMGAADLKEIKAKALHGLVPD
jgi:hypothetical protein